MNGTTPNNYFALKWGQEHPSEFIGNILVKNSSSGTPMRPSANQDQNVVLLIDEVDRSDEEFEAFLLNTF
jgi:MoxR-like ATPase